ncbi:MAG: hypothetical protein IT363_06895 [Methanoregulaceae archaeon]|nr:hypothetical protein [Methanoregulaceae archaeon]
MRTRSWLMVGLVSVAMLALAQGVTLKRTPKVDEVQKFKLRMEFGIFGDTAVYTSVLTQKVTEVKPDGNYAVEATQSDYKVELFGDEGVVRDEDLPKQSITYTPSGDVVAVQGGLVNESVYRLANLMAVRLPKVAVSKGDKWECVVPKNVDTGVFEAKATYTYDDDEKIGEFDTIRAEFEYAEVAGDPARGQGKVWLNKRDGSVVKLETNWTSAPIPGAPTPLTGAVILERIP